MSWKVGNTATHVMTINILSNKFRLKFLVGIFLFLQRHLLPPDVLYFTTEMPCGCDPRLSPNWAKNNGIMRWGFRVFNLHLSNPLGQSGSSLFVVGDDISLCSKFCVVGVGLKPHDPLRKKKFRPKTLLLEEIFFVRTPYKMQSSRQFNNDRAKSTTKKSIDQPILVGDELVWNRLNCRPVMNRLGPTLHLISRGMNIFMSLFYRNNNRRSALNWNPDDFICIFILQKLFIQIWPFH